MPSRQIPPSSSPDPPLTPPHQSLILAGGVTAAFSLLILFTFCFRKKRKTVPPDSKTPRRFSYSDLRRATSSFSASHRLGQGGFGSVYRGTLKRPNLDVAVKVMDAGSIQGEREFQTELLFAGKMDSDLIVSVIGFSSDPKRRRMVLVYELMSNGSLQDCLLRRRSPDLIQWNKRFDIAIDIARGLEYLHHHCDPPVIHGDIKPSNILLNQNFKPKISDFGLAWFKSNDQCEIAITNNKFASFDSLNQSPEKSPETVPGGDVSPPVSAALSLREALAMASPSSEVLERTSESETETGSGWGVRRSGKLGLVKSLSGKDWWWKQDDNGVKKDYVREWIRNEIKNPKNEYVEERKKNKRVKRRATREWWKQEYCEELERKKKKKKKKKQESISDVNDSGENWWPLDEGLEVVDIKKKRRWSRSSSRVSHNSNDSGSEEGSKSGGNSSTSSKRGTVCYNAPENNGVGVVGGEVSEKCDVYSFGVLLLVLIAGRRPLEMTDLPISEFKRANLLSWARHLARQGRLLDLVDQSVQSLDRKQALLCITVALICLQKSPASRPSMKEVVAMLSGELESPQLPVELSPSPPSHVRFKSQKKVR